MSTVSINVIGNETYVKDCSIERPWDLDTSEEQAEKIAKGCKSSCINIRHVQLYDNLGRIAEALSGGRIQLRQSESKKELSGKRSWMLIPTQAAKGWKDIYVTYVYLGEIPSSRLAEQAEKNPTRVLFTAGITFPNQYVGLSNDLKLVIGDHLEEVVKYIQGEKVKEI